MQSLKILRDPIHDYVAYSALEEAIIDSPLFQRLRYVSQNALAHQTYPSNRTARFTHSLGVMHLGGRFFQAGLRNADLGVVKAFQLAASALVTAICQTHNLDFDRICRYLREHPDPFYRHAGVSAPGGDSEELAAVQACLLQGLRLACVIHDIGHPPFSHTGEAVLDAQLAVPISDSGSYRADFVRDLTGVRAADAPAMALHEAAGIRLMEHIFRKYVPAGDGEQFGQLCLWLARGVVRGGLSDVPDPNAVLAALHDIVSSDLDADRADYVQRDGYASAFEFGNYDLDRIILLIVLVSDESGFRFRPSTVALSAVESFFIERFRIYRYLVFHHGVARSHVCLQRALHLLFHLYLDDRYLAERERRPVETFLAARGFDRFWKPFANGGDPATYVGCDENWLLSLFRDTLDSDLLAGPSLPEALALLRTCLNLVCERNKKLVRPLWKRLDEYQDFARSFQTEATDHRYDEFFAASANAALNAVRKGDPVLFLNAVLGTQLSLIGPGGLPIAGGDVAVFERFEEALTREWPDLPGRLLFSFLSRLKAGPSADYSLVDRTSGRTVPLAELSRQAMALEDVWGRDVQAWAFLIPGRRVGDRFEALTDAPQAADLRRDMAPAAARVLLDLSWRASELMGFPTTPQEEAR